MQEISSDEELLKVDRRGHVRVSAERREALLDEFERSGVSAMQLCRTYRRQIPDLRDVAVSVIIEALAPVLRLQGK